MSWVQEVEIGNNRDRQQTQNWSWNDRGEKSHQNQNQSLTTSSREMFDDIVVLDETPASPTPDDSTEKSSNFVTRVHMEVADENEIVIEGVSFAIDCQGTNSQGGDDDVEVVGAISGEPCCSSSLRDDGPKSSSKLFAEQKAPIYEVESDIMITEVSSLANKVYRPKREEPVRKKNTCWNCDGDHVITVCTEPRNPQKITENRNKFMANKRQNDSNYGKANGSYNKPNNQQSFNNNRRYHEDDGNDVNRHRYGRGKPGFISDELKIAMGLRENQLPSFIYKMRVYGYPPGWLEHAMDEASSGLKLYGDNVTLQLGTSKKDSRFIADQLITYPGFNAPMPYGLKDEAYLSGSGYAKYSEEDSLENMLKRLNATCSSPEKPDDGIRSQSSKDPPEKWDYNSLAGLEKPKMNDGARYGIGRGKYKEPPRQRNNQIGQQSSATSGRPSQNNSSGIYVGDQRLRVPAGPRIPSEVQTQEIDSRYLPSVSKVNKSHHKSHGRSSSPSLLGSKGGGGGNSSSNVERPSSPVILNKPPPPSTQNDEYEIRKKVICDDSDDDTGSSDAFGNCSPKRNKRRKVNAADSDDDVMIIATDDEMGSDKSDDSVCLLPTNSLLDSPLGKTASPLRRLSLDDRPKTATASPLATTTTNNASGRSVPEPDVVMLDSSPASPASPPRSPSPSNSESDWESNEPKKIREKPKVIPKKVTPVPSPGSSTGSEADMQIYQDLEIVENDNINNGTNNSSFDDGASNEGSCSSSSVKIISSRKRVFIPPKPEHEAYKKVLLSVESDEDDPKDGEKNSEVAEKTAANISFGSLPGLNNFAAGMPEMVFEEEPAERTGRLDRVMEILKKRKSAPGQPDVRKF